MAASLVSMPDFLRGRAPRRTRGPWTNQELAELQRVVDLLARAGLMVDAESGLTDENEPWMAFTRPGSDEVIAHFARIDGRFVAAGVGAGLVIEGESFRDVVDKILARQPLLFSQADAITGGGEHHLKRTVGERTVDAPPGGSTSPTNGGDRKGGTVTSLFSHPSVVLAAFVATALMQDRKATDGAGPSAGSTPTAKATLDLRAAPGVNGRPTLHDSLIALSTADTTAGGVGGHGGFMLHSSGMASAMAIVLASVTSGAGVGEDRTTIMEQILALRTHGEDLSDTADGDATRAADDDGESRAGATTSLGDAAPEHAGPEAGDETPSNSRKVVAEAGEDVDTNGLPADPAQADVFLDELLRMTGPNGETGGATGAAGDASGGGDPALKAAGTELGLGPNGGAVADGGGTDATQNADGSGTGETGGEGDGTRPALGSARADTSDTSLINGVDLWDLASLGGSVGGTVGMIALTDEAVRLLDGLRTGNLTADRSLEVVRDDMSDLVPVPPSRPVSEPGSIGSGAGPESKWLVLRDDPLADDDEPNMGGSTPGMDPSHQSGSLLIVYSGGFLKIIGFDPSRDMLLNVTGPFSETGTYDIVNTDDGVDIRFDDDNMVSLIGVGLDDLGLV